MAVSRFAAWYPRQFARTIARVLVNQDSVEECYPNLVPVIDEHPRPEETETRQTKRAKISETGNKESRRIEEDNKENASKMHLAPGAFLKRARQEFPEDKQEEIVLEDKAWKELFLELQKVLPKAGVTVWNDQSLPLIQQ